VSERGRPTQLFLLLLAAGLAGAALLWSARAPEPVVNKYDPVVELPRAATVLPLPLPPPPGRAADPPAPEPRPAERGFPSGFCPPHGSEERIVVARTLQRFVAEARSPLERAAAKEVQLAIAAGPVRGLEALRRARKLLPDEPSIGAALALATRDSPDLDEAIDGLAVYLAVEPAAPLSRLRARLEVQRDLQRDFRRLSRSGITVLWAPEALTDAKADDLARAIEQALGEAARFTDTERRPALTVVVYPGQSELMAVSCARAWAGGLYDGTLRLVAAPAFPGGINPVQLRHEVLHAQVVQAAPRAPLWFHEGLAQSFAGELGAAQRYWPLMVRNRSWIPFSSLHETFQVFEATDDAGLAYAESLGLVELLRESGGDRAIAEAVRAFQQGASTEAALARATGRREVTGNDLLDVIARRLNKLRAR
jgi:hypothetical protein